MAIQKEPKITRDIDYTLEATFAGDEDINELIRHHWSYAWKWSIRSWNAISRIFYDDGSPTSINRSFGLMTPDMIDSNEEEIITGENAFYEHEPWRMYNNIVNGRIDDGDKYNRQVCDDYYMCHDHLFDAPPQYCGNDPYAMAFGDDKTCDCCGTDLNVLNRSCYGLCEGCDNSPVTRGQGDEEYRDSPSSRQFEL